MIDKVLLIIAILCGSLLGGLHFVENDPAFYTLALVTTLVLGYYGHQILVGKAAAVYANQSNHGINTPALLTFFARCHKHQWKDKACNKWQIPTLQECSCGLSRSKKLGVDPETGETSVRFPEWHWSNGRITSATNG